jgi:putative FmdB family regulatory protein
MPTYSFVCRECGQAFEKRLRMSQSGEVQDCPACGSDDTRKSIGAVAVSSGTSTRSAPARSAPPVSSPFS